MVLTFLAILLALLVAAFARNLLGPWPSALRVRWSFDKDGVAVNARLAKHVPPGVSALRNEHYDPTDRDAWLDVYFPESVDLERALPTIVWVHGGGWLAGSKNQVENYARILASKSYTVITVDYSLAPWRKYPTPVRQVAVALRFVRENAARLHVDASKLFLAGDSAGAQIAAQLATLICAPSYAERLGIRPPLSSSALAGTLLFCGRYDAKRPPFGVLPTVMLWSYSGTKRFMTEPSFATFSVLDFVTSEFPRTFISCGNGDSLHPHSVALADALERVGVPVETLLFPDDHSPALPHEYQFNLDSEAGQLALGRALSFLARRSAEDATVAAEA